MAPRDPNKIQLDFPVLVADLIDQLKIKGTVGLLDFVDSVSPVFLVGSRGITFGSQLPDFDSAEVFSGKGASPASNTIIMDTGPLAAGTYDMTASLSFAGTSAVGGALVLDHRNAANDTTLAQVLALSMAAPAFANQLTLPLVGYNIALNERFRAQNPGFAMVGTVEATIMIALRPTP